MRPLSPPAGRRLGVLVAAVAPLVACGPRRTGEPAPQQLERVVSAPDGVRIAFESRGEGSPAIVFVHGWSCDRSYWASQMDAFSGEHTVVAVDLAGHGASGLGRAEWTMAAFGGDVAAVVERLDLPRVVLVGHSMGGDVIAEAARRLPGRVAGLIWADVYKRLGPGRTPEEVEAIAAPFRTDFAGTTRAFVRGMFPPGSDSALVARVVADMASAPPAVAIGALENAMSYSREMPRTLQALRLPVIAINPDAPPTDVASMERAGVKVVIMPGVGHFLPLEDSVRFNGLLRDAIRSLAP